MTDEDKKLLQEIEDIFRHNYSNTTFATRLYEMFGKKDDAIIEYIKVGRKFWHYNIDTHKFRKIVVTYIRSGVMFFVYEDEPETEYAWFICSFNSFSLHAAEIYPYEIGKILSNYHEHAAEEFPEICKQCKWDTCDGRITVDVIWDKEK